MERTRGIAYIIDSLKYAAWMTDEVNSDVLQADSGAAAPTIGREYTQM